MTVRRIASLAVAVLVLGGCAVAPQPNPTPAPTSGDGVDGVAVVEDLDFGGPGGIRLDVCMPDETSAEPRAAIISVHGGGWSQGDKAEPLWRDSCTWLADQGFVVFQTNYRLAPEHPYPAAIEDISTAVEWIRDDAQAERFGYDPARLGAFGDSAGGNLVSLLATRGEGPTDAGTRVAAVVELSAPLDLTEAGTALGDLDPGFQSVQLAYLGCESYDACAGARAASPVYFVDPTDPPFFIVHSVDEFIPVEQARAFVELLDEAAVEVTYTEVPGIEHALGILDADLRTSIAEWLKMQLAV